MIFVRTVHCDIAGTVNYDNALWGFLMLRSAMTASLIEIMRINLAVMLEILTLENRPMHEEVRCFGLKMK